MSYVEAIQSWQKTLSILKDGMNHSSYKTWFEGLKLHSAEDGKLIVVSDDNFVIQHVRERFWTLFSNAVLIGFGEPYEILLIQKDEVSKYEKSVSSSMLNPKYTFDTFVVGQSNRFAHAASLAVAELPGEAYNPLFIYGGVGLGKTHLMNAIAHFILAENPKKNILFITSESFTNEVIDAIARKRTQELRNKMRSVDVLLVDDVQFLTNKTATQEEFFHTFNALFENGKQIILSSDRPPREIQTLEERMQSRFMSGLIVDVQKPDFETRMAILQKKAQSEGIDIDADVVSYIAGKIDTNIRELEGSLIRVNAMADVMHSRITEDVAQEALKNLIAVKDEKRITPQLIMDVICNQYGVTREDLLSSRRSRDVAMPRQLSIYLCREIINLSTTRIGREFGRDHSTIMHACEKMTDAIKRDSAFQKRVEDLKREIREK